MSKDLPVVRGENAVLEAETDLLSSALAVANRGQNLIYERLDEMGDQHLVAATQMAGRVVSTKRRWQYAATPGEGTAVKTLAELLTSMPHGGKVTVSCEVSKPGDDAIDVSSASSVEVPKVQVVAK